MSEEEKADLARRRQLRKGKVKDAWKMIIRPLLVTTILFAFSQAVIMEVLIQRNAPDPKETFPVESAIELCQEKTQEMSPKPQDFGSPFFEKLIDSHGSFEGWSIKIPLWNQEDSKPASTICFTDKYGKGLYYLRTQGLEGDDLYKEFPPLLTRMN